MKPKRFRNLLVPVDFSRLSSAGVEMARRLSHRFGGTIHLAHVYHILYPAGFVDAPRQWSELTLSSERELRRALSGKLASLAAALGPKAAVKVHLESGAPVYHVVCSLAAQLPADLIVLATHGRTGVKRFFLGSVAERIVQHAPCPVLVTPGSSKLALTNEKSPPPLGITRILAPIDMSKGSRDAVRYAISLAAGLRATLLLLHVMDLGYSEARRRDRLPRLARAALARANEEMRRFLRRFDFGTVEFRAESVVGRVTDQICKFARDHSVHLIVTATHGLTGFEHVLIGSVAERLVREAPVPVLVVPSHPGVRMANLQRIGDWQSQQDGFRRPRRELPRRLGAKTSAPRTAVRHPFPERRKTNKFRESHRVPAQP